MLTNEYCCYFLKNSDSERNRKDLCFTFLPTCIIVSFLQFYIDAENNEDLRDLKDINHEIYEDYKTLIDNWNKKVSENDTVYILGDLSWSKNGIEFYQSLKGNKVLIKGNHDNWTDDFYRNIGFDYVSKFPIIYGGTPDNNGFYMMSHAPLMLSETTPYWNFYGHVHNDSKFADTSTSKCVCVERVGYKPYLFLEKN